MPQNEVWFYVLADALETTRRQFIVKFCDAATRRNRQAVILCNSLNEAEDLDLRIWQDSKPESFIAHSINNQCPAPIQLLTEAMPTEGDILLNLTDQLLTITGYQRIVEIVNPDNREASRTRWRHYQQIGLKPELKPL